MAKVRINAVLLSLLIIVKDSALQNIGNDGWSYYNIDNWGRQYPSCIGFQQSPIDISSQKHIVPIFPKLSFINYDVYFDVELENNGHTVVIEIPEVNGGRPIVTGDRLSGSYEALNIHFHWGSPNGKGSEHKINEKRFDVEMHIVHKNAKYATLQEAQAHRDGLLVLAIFLEAVEHPTYQYPGLQIVIDSLSKVSKGGSKARLNSNLSLDNFKANLDESNFFTYYGSLTTPPCTEAVVWIVFRHPHQIPANELKKFFKLLDLNGKPLLDTFRPLQNRNQRLIGKRGNGLTYFREIAHG